ncbi:hypothetical protein NL676_029299 [Syzygium grande]|nr:hypothetical protein NL676_029299 [Syzygium grande]
MKQASLDPRTGQRTDLHHGILSQSPTKSGPPLGGEGVARPSQRPELESGRDRDSRTARGGTARALGARRGSPATGILAGPRRRARSSPTTDLRAARDAELL